MGACGVAAAAASAHVAGAERLGSVALVLLTHAAALLALTQRKGFLAAAVVMAFGATLFALEVSLFTLRGAHLFPLAAPTGGLSLILGWLMVFFASLVELSRKPSGTLP
jgi:uncharacterized membrane protein YgdD (TMEM256/DUF423 family)